MCVALDFTGKQRELWYWEHCETTLSFSFLICKWRSWSSWSLKSPPALTFHDSWNWMKWNTGHLGMAHKAILCIYFPIIYPYMGFLVAQMVKSLPAMQETRVWSLGQKDPLEIGMATHSSILAWKIPWMEEPGGLQSKGSQRVGHNWAISPLFMHLFSNDIPILNHRLDTDIFSVIL